MYSARGVVELLYKNMPHATALANAGQSFFHECALALRYARKNRASLAILIPLPFREGLGEGSARDGVAGATPQ